VAVGAVYLTFEKKGSRKETELERGPENLDCCVLLGHSVLVQVSPYSLVRVASLASEAWSSLPALHSVICCVLLGYSVLVQVSPYSLVRVASLASEAWSSLPASAFRYLC
jgi:hypothetical protein